MNDLYQSYAAQIKQKLNGFTPQTLLILGSGLNALAANIQNSMTIKYSEIRDFPASTVEGHVGQFVAGTLGGQKVLCMQGRFHLYEGIAPQIINQVISAFKLLGITRMVITNAAGSLNPKIPAGSIMLLTDHINFSHVNPLIGPNDETTGPRFPDLSHAYSPALNTLAVQAAKELKIPLKQGVYLMVTGPNFETAAEVKAFRRLGADAVGMSTVPEVICAARLGMETLGFSVITNMGAGLQKQAQSHAETLSAASKASANLARLIAHIFERL